MATAIMKQKEVPEMDDVEEIISKISEDSPYKRRPTQKRTWMTVPEMGKLAVKMTVQTYAVVRGILGFIFTLLIIATAYCYHDWVQVAFLFSLSVILYLILFAGVFVDTVLDMTRERIIDFIIS